MPKNRDGHEDVQIKDILTKSTAYVSFWKQICKKAYNAPGNSWETIWAKLCAIYDPMTYEVWYGTVLRTARTLEHRNI
jgi:hypothetical protein